MNLKIIFKRLFVLMAIWNFGACDEKEVSEKLPGEILGMTLKDASDKEVSIQAFETNVKELTVNVLVPGPTDLKTLTPYFTLNEGATLLYNSSVAYNGKETDFSTPKPAQVKGQDGAVKEYTVTIERSGKSGYISDVTFAEGVAPELVEIDQVMKTINIYFPKGAILTALKPFFVIEDGAVLLGDIPNGSERDMSQPLQVSIQGTNYAITEYTVIASLPKFELDQEMFRGQGALTASGSLAVSGNKLVVLTDWNSGNFHYMDLITGEHDPSDKLIVPTDIPYGYAIGHLRKFARDDKGVLLSMHLSMAAGLVAYKWDNLTATPVKYIDLPWIDAGITVQRLAGLSIIGDLSGNAKILFVHATKKLLTFTVEGGVLDPVPVVTDIKTNAANLNNYSTIIPVVGSEDFLLPLGEGQDHTGVEYYRNGNLLFTIAAGGAWASNGRTFEYEGRKYLAVAITNKNNWNRYNIYDITDPTDVTRSVTPVFSEQFTITGNANAILDSDYVIIDGQLYVYFIGVGSPYVCYRFK